MKSPASHVMVRNGVQKQKGSVVTFILVVLVAVVIGCIWVQVSNRPPKAKPEKIIAVAHAQAIANECANNTSGKMVLVRITAQHMWACNGTDMVEQSAVTTGASEAPNGINDATPVGTWHVYEKFRNLYLRGQDVNGPWNDYVQYWMPFDSAVGFHDASWQTFPFGSQQYKTGGSHGCVQLPTNVAAWLYGWAPVGTTVVVQA